LPYQFEESFVSDANVMSEPTYNQQMITQYLLGALPEAERERFDELSISNDELANALSAAEKDLVDAYVQGELSGATAAQFEAHYLASPLRREKVKFAQAFHVFAQKDAGMQVAKVPAERPMERGAAAKRAGWSTFFAPRSALQWGLSVAALVLLIAGGWLAFENIRLRQQMSQTQVSRDALVQREQDLQQDIAAQRSTNAKTEQELALVRAERERLEQELKQARDGAKSSTGAGSIVSLILAPPLRSANHVPTISIDPGTKQVAAQLQLEAGDYSAYRVALIDSTSNRTLWRSGNLKLTGQTRKSLTAIFRADLLKPRNYILTVTGISSGGSEIVGDYPFRVLK
jgi:anti-sigma factor RsiW